MKRVISLLSMEKPFHSIIAPELLCISSSAPFTSKLAEPATTLGSVGLPNAEPVPINMPTAVPMAMYREVVFVNGFIMFLTVSVNSVLLELFFISFRMTISSTGRQSE